MEKPPFVSVIVLNHDGYKFIRPCLSSLIKTDYPNFEIIFVDSLSTSQSAQEAERSLKNFPRHKIIASQESLGWSGGNNLGLKNARGEIIAFLSNDTEVDPLWLKELVGVLTSKPEIGIVQAKSLAIFDKKTLDSGKNYVDVFGFCYSETPSQKPEEVFFAEGVAFALKKEVLDKIGLFDQDFIIMYDDIDLSWRARLAGFKVMIAPSSVVFHHRGGTVGEGILKIKPAIVYLNVRNHLTSLLKIYERKNLWLYLPPVIAAQFIKAFLFLFVHRQTKAAAAVMRGLFSLIKNRREIIKKRQGVQKTRSITDREIKKAMVKFSPRLLLNIFRTRKTLGAQILEKKD
ncbi:MAG: glycosyltransferase family 2 protein [Patescibacteria group bacterium]